MTRSSPLNAHNNHDDDVEQPSPPRRISFSEANNLSFEMMVPDPPGTSPASAQPSASRPIILLASTRYGSRSKGWHRNSSHSISSSNLKDISHKSFSQRSFNFDSDPKVEESSKRDFRKVAFWSLVVLIPVLITVYFLLFASSGEETVPNTRPIVDRPIQESAVLNATTVAPTAVTITMDEPSASPTQDNSIPLATDPPVATVTAAPTVPATLSVDVIKEAIQDFLLENDIDPRRPSANPIVKKAVDWLLEEATAAKSMAFPLNQKYLQRFGVLILYYSVFETQSTQVGVINLPNPGMRTQDECFWKGMTCNRHGMLTDIKLSNQQLDGTIPLEWGFFPHLKSVDFSSNGLKGSIPQELYDIRGLEQVFLHHNQLTGTISSKIGNLWGLTHFHVSDNQLSGSIPSQMASQGNQIRQIRYFNVHRNQMTGSIPTNMRLRQMFVMDLGRNQFNGTLPSELGSEYVRLRHLYLDHNKFTGTVPDSYINAGNGRIMTLTLNNNELTGDFPGNHQILNKMNELRIEHNNFKSMNRTTCSLGVLSGGELVEFRSDCAICRCGVGFMCKTCVPF